MQRWQYRTVLFEFQRDGLLGDRFLDDEQVAEWLNRAGGEGWELVSVCDVKEGLLLILKRPAGEMGDGSPRPQGQSATPATAPPQGSFRQRLQRQEQEHIRRLNEQQQEKTRLHEENQIGDIKIR